MSLSVQVRHVPQFFEVDPMRVVWNGAYFNFFEEARSVLLESLGIGYERLAKDGYMLYVVKNSAKYKKPVQLHQPVLIKATLTEYEYLFRIKYEVHDEESGALCTIGESEQMLARVSDGKALMIVPEEYRKLVEAHR